MSLTGLRENITSSKSIVQTYVETETAMAKYSNDINNVFDKPFEHPVKVLGLKSFSTSSVPRLGRFSHSGY